MTSKTSKDEGPSREFLFKMSGSGIAPWEIDRPQLIVCKLVEQGLFQGEILDIGCGIADNAIYIAERANNVHLTAIDLVPKAIEIAREKAAKANVNIQFEVLDFLEDISTTNLKKHSYDTILDSAVFHIFSNEDRQRYMKNLEYLIKPGGLYIQIVINEKEIYEKRTRLVTKSDLIQLFSSENGWIIQSIEDDAYDAKLDNGSKTIFAVYLSIIKRNNII